MPTFRGAIFDVDGVLVDSPHQQAWRESLRELMESDWADIRDQTTWSPDAFTPQVYQQYMSGKPRMAGAVPRSTTSTYPTPRSGPPSTGSANRRWSCASSRPGTSPPTPTRCGS